MSTTVNGEQAEAWNGPEGQGWARDWERYDLAVAEHHRALVAATGVLDGEHILDIGCGNGQTTRELARRSPTGRALGADLSAPMLERARALADADGLANVEFVEADAQVHPVPEGTFDLAVSRFGTMFFGDRVAAFANVHRALAPGGRIAFIVWQDMAANTQFATIAGSLAHGRVLPAPPPGAPSPFSLADPAVARAELGAAGFVDIDVAPVHGSFHAGADADDALAFIGRTTMAVNLLDGLDEPSRAEALATLHEAFRAHETPEGVRFDSATWLITAGRGG